jgi:hypothetical protein
MRSLHRGDSFVESETVRDRERVREKFTLVSK